MYVYILKSKKDGSFYVGSTKNLQERFLSHNHRGNLSTKTNAPWELIRAEEYHEDSLALKQEKFLKSARGRKVIRNLSHSCGVAGSGSVW